MLLVPIWTSLLLLFSHRSGALRVLALSGEVFAEEEGDGLLHLLEGRGGVVVDNGELEEARHDAPLDGVDDALQLGAEQRRPLPRIVSLASERGVHGREPLLEVRHQVLAAITAPEALPALGSF